MEHRRRVMELAVTFPINQLGSAEGDVCKPERVHKTACSLVCGCVCVCKVILCMQLHLSEYK